MNEELQHVPPALLLRSFLLVAGGYVTSLISLFVLALGLALLFFPETVKAIGSEPEVFEQQLQENPEQVLPNALFWPLILLYSASCFGIGFVVARLAPFASFPHCIFLAVIIFAGFLQQAIGSPAPLQWMMVLFMAAAPIAVLLGGQSSLKRAQSDTSTPPE